MPRRVVWLPYLPSIRQAVDKSFQAHYSRDDIEKLFQVQSRTANLILGLLPTVKVGTSYLVEKAVLARFLAQLDSAADPAHELKRIEALRTRRTNLKPKLPQVLYSDQAPTRVDSLPESVSVTRGRVQIECDTLDELAGALYALASLFERDLGTLVELFEEAPQRAVNDDELDDITEMWDDLERREKEYAIHKARQGED